MRWLATLLAGALALAGCGAEQRAPQWPEPSPALWEVRHPDSGLGSPAQQAEGWLFGTIHALPDGADWRTPVLDGALDRSGVLVVEVAELGNRAAAAEAFARRARTPGLPPLTERVPAAERPALRAALAASGLAERDFTDVESWAAALQLASAMRRHDSANGVDRTLIAEAGRVMGLESFDAQFALFDSLPSQAQARLLVAVAQESGADDQDERTAAWLTGDLARLTQDAERGLLSDPDLREVLQLRRNRAWAQRIEASIAAGERPFVAVGAAHMLGEQGLPALLAARGYEVRRIQ